MNAKLKALLETFRENDFPEFSEVKVDNPFVRSPFTGEGLLHFVAIWGGVDGARLLLDAGVGIDWKGEDDFTALHQAIVHEHLEMVKLLLSRGADPTRKCLLGTGFELAARNNNPEIRQYLANIYFGKHDDPL